MISLEIKNSNTTLTEKLQTKISALSLGKMDKWEYRREQSKLTYSSLGQKNFGKTTKKIEHQGDKSNKSNWKKHAERQVLDPDQKPIAGFFSKYFLSEEAIYELNKIKEL